MHKNHRSSKEKRGAGKAFGSKSKEKASNSKSKTDLADMIESKDAENAENQIETPPTLEKEEAIDLIFMLHWWGDDANHGTTHLNKLFSREFLYRLNVHLIVYTGNRLFKAKENLKEKNLNVR